MSQYQDPQQGGQSDPYGNPQNPPYGNQPDPGYQGYQNPTQNPTQGPPQNQPAYPPQQPGYQDPAAYNAPGNPYAPPPGYGAPPVQAGPPVLSIISFVCSAIGLLFIPLLFGGGAIVLGAVAQRRGERLGRVALIVGIIATVAGFVIGAAFGVYRARQGG